MKRLALGGVEVELLFTANILAHLFPDLLSNVPHLVLVDRLAVAAIVYEGVVELIPEAYPFDANKANSPVAPLMGIANRGNESLDVDAKIQGGNLYLLVVGVEVDEWLRLSLRIN